jgi:hypothetical protein
MVGQEQESMKESRLFPAKVRRDSRMEGWDGSFEEAEAGVAVGEGANGVSESLDSLSHLLKFNEWHSRDRSAAP